MEKVKFSKITTYMSIDGTERKCKGLQMFVQLENMETREEFLVVQPVNTRGGIGQAYVAIPRKDIPNIIKALESLKG